MTLFPAADRRALDHRVEELAERRLAEVVATPPAPQQFAKGGMGWETNGWHGPHCMQARTTLSR